MEPSLTAVPSASGPARDSLPTAASREAPPNPPASDCPEPSARPLFLLPAAMLAVFGSAWLLFTVQPLIGKIVLPRFGGSAAVWSVCLVFFQTALLAGYALAYGLQRVPLRAQLIGFSLVWLLAALWFQIPPREQWSLTDPNRPGLQLLGQLAWHLTLPCVLLAAVSVLVQTWARRAGLRDPYWLYAISNVGSLGALLAYPTWIEPAQTVVQTAHLWQRVFLLEAVILAALAWTVNPGGPRVESPEAAPELAAPEHASSAAPLTFGRRLQWLGLSALGSALLVSVTAEVTRDIAPIPLLWVIPLAVYLVSFVVCFGDQRFYQRDWIVPLTLLAAPAYLAMADLGERFAWTLVEEIGVTAVTFLGLCLICHGELFRLRPTPARLSDFYLTVAAGGALGGWLITFGAPSLIPWPIERIALVAIVLVICLWLSFWRGARLLHQPILNILASVALVVGSVTHSVHGLLKPQAGVSPLQELKFARNLYGTLRLERYAEVDVLLHGTTLHGMQVRKGDQGAFMPISYYSIHSALGMLHQSFLTQRTNINLGCLGLGAGSMAAYTRPGDHIAFYEIDPNAAAWAQSEFTFLAKARGTVAVKLGDGRMLLEREPDQGFDLLLIDAFSGDGVPVHLLTRQAWDVYLRHVNPDGFLLFHISNNYLDLGSILGNTAEAMGLHALLLEHFPESPLLQESSYILVTRQPVTLESKRWEDNSVTVVTPAPRNPDLRLWTDDYSSLWGILLSLVPDEEE